MRAYISIACFCAGVAAASAQETTNATVHRLSLADCIQMALEHNLDLQMDRLNPEIYRFQVGIAYAGYDPNFSVSGQHGFNQAPGGFYGPTGQSYLSSTRDADGGTASVSGSAPTGMRYALSGNLSDSYGINSGGPFDNRTSSANLSLSQPILKNAWIDSNRLNIRTAKKDLKGSELTLQTQIIDIVTQVETSYYDLIFAKDYIGVQELAVKLAQQLLEENQKKVKFGALAPLDEEQAKSQVAQSTARLISARQVYAQQQNVVKRLLNDNFASWQEDAINPSESLKAIPQSFSLQDSWHKGLTTRPDLQKLKVDLERQDIVLRFNRNQIFPELNVLGSYGYSTSQSKDTFGNIMPSTGDHLNPNWSFGAELKVPLSNRKAGYDYKTNRARKQQMLLSYKKAEQDVMIQIDDAIKDAKTAFERVKATGEARQFASMALNAEKTKLAAGKSTSFVVLQLQNNLTLASSDEIRAKADYAKALATLSRAEGSTFERHQLNLSGTEPKSR